MRPTQPWLDQANEGVDGVVGGDRRGGLEGTDDLDRVRRQPDLLLGLAQGGCDEIAIGVIVAAARERDLAGVAAQIIAAAGEHGVELVVLQVERHEHGRIGSAADLERDRLLRCEQHARQLVVDRSPRRRHPAEIY